MQPNLNDKIQQAKAAGYSDTEIQGYLQQTGMRPPAPTGGLRVTGAAPTISAPSTTAPRTTGRGGTLTSLISEGGALGGAAAGAALGSAVPVIGTAIGGIIGAGLGAFGGRLAENKVRDDRLGVTDALKEGALTAALSGPLRLGKYATTATKGLIAGKGAQAALTTAAKKAADLSLRKSLGLGVTKASKDLAIKQFRLNPSQLTKFAKKHGEDVTELISRYKIGNADDIANKGINPLLSTFDDIVDNIPDIPKKDLQKILNKEVSVLLKSPVEVNRRLGVQLQSQVDTLLKSQPSKIPGVIAKKLRQEFDDVVPYTLAGSPERSIAKKTADGLRKVLQNAADKAGLTGPNGMPIKQLGREISALIDLDDIVFTQSNLGRGSLPIGIISSLGGVSGAITGAGAGGVGGAAVGGPVGAILGAGATQALNSPTGRRLLAQLGTGAGGRLAQAGARATSQPIRQAVTGAARGALVGGAGRILTGEPTLEDALMVTPTTTPQLGAVPTGMGAMEQPAIQPEAPQNPFTPELLITAIASDPKNAALYERLYKVYEDRYKTTTAATKPLTEAQQSRQDVIDLTQGALDLLATGRVKTGAVSGRLEQAKGVLGIADETTLEFNTLVSNLLATIAKARAGTSFTAGEKALLERYAPKVGDSGQQLRTKLRLLQQQFGRPTNVTSLEEALISQTGGAQ